MARKKPIPDLLLSLNELRNLTTPEIDEHSAFSEEYQIKLPLMNKISQVFNIVDIKSSPSSFTDICDFNLRKFKENQAWSFFGHKTNSKINYARKKSAHEAINKHFLHREFSWGYSLQSHQQIKCLVVGADYLSIDMTKQSPTQWAQISQHHLSAFINQQFLQEMIEASVIPIIYASGNRSVYAAFPFQKPISPQEAEEIINSGFLFEVLKSEIQVNSTEVLKIRSYDNNLSGAVRLPLGTHQETEALSLLIDADLKDSIRMMMDYEVPDINLHTVLFPKNSINIEVKAEQSVKRSRIQEQEVLSPSGTTGQLSFASYGRLGDPDGFTQAQIDQDNPGNEHIRLSPSGTTGQLAEPSDFPDKMTQLANWYQAQDAGELVEYLGCIPQGLFWKVMNYKRGFFILGFMCIYGSKEEAFTRLRKLAQAQMTDQKRVKDRLLFLNQYQQRNFINWQDTEGIFLRQEDADQEHRKTLILIQTQLDRDGHDRRLIRSIMTVAAYCLAQLARNHHALASRTLRNKLRLSRPTISKCMILLRTEYPMMRIREDSLPPWAGGKARRYELNHEYFSKLNRMAGHNHESSLKNQN